MKQYDVNSSGFDDRELNIDWYDLVTSYKSDEGSHPSGRKEHGKGSEKDDEDRGMRPLFRFLIKLGVVALAAAAVFIFVLGVHINHGNRMYPFVLDGDLVITYKLDSYNAGDVVAYKNPLTGKTEISRIAAIGAGEIAFTGQGELMIDGYIPPETVFYPTRELDGSDIRFPYNIAEDGVFLLDDYRVIGSDSRVFGSIPRSSLIGKVVYIFRRRGI